jgi:hypothetical protein
MARLNLLLSFMILAISCTKKYQPYVSHYAFKEQSPIPDYSNLDYWAAHPWKHDPSDSIPSPLQHEPMDSVADVFFVYPTTYTDARTSWNADVNDAYLNAKTDYSTILYQASVFNQHCRIFSPRYRQAHLQAFFVDSAQSNPIFDTAYADVKRAFEYYLEHYHHDRPLIIAGHSQGAKLAERLLKEFFDGQPLHRYLVAAYIVGWPIPEGSFENINVCADSTQTGCFCGWRTLRKDYMLPYIEQERPVSYVTNPLSWDTTKNYVSVAKNQGSILRDFNKLIPNTTDAQIHEGVLWVNKPKFPGSAFYGSKNYHIADINLFYMNLRRNIETRIRKYSATVSQP